MQKAILGFLALFLCAGFASGQKAAFEFYTPDGWVSGLGAGIVQDSRGLIWFLKSNKLYRFDGRNFWTYPPRPATLPGSTDRLIGLRGIYQDSLLFLTGEQFVFILNPATGHWQSFQQNTGNRADNYRILGLTNARWRNTYYLLTQSEQKPGIINGMVFKGNSVAEYPILSGLTHDHYRYHTIDSSGNHYLIKSDSILKWNARGGLLAQAAMHPQAQYVGIQFDPAGTPVLLNKDELFILNERLTVAREHPATRHLKQKKAQVNNFILDADGNLWICGNDRGLFYYEAAKDTLYNFQDALKRTIPYHCDLLALFPDRSGVIWVETRIGILKINPQPYPFDTYFFDKTGNDVYYSFRGISEDIHGKIFAAYYGGIATLDPDSKKELAVLCRNQVPFGMITNPQGIWLNSGQLMDPASGSIKSVSGDRSKSSDDTGIFAKDNRGRLWWVYHHSLYYLNDQSGWTLELDLPQKARFESESMHAGRHSNNIWIGYRGVLFEYGPDRKQLKQYLPVDWGIPVARILAIEEDKQRNLWLGTDAGLIRFNPATKEVRRFSTDQGLPDNFICGILTEGDSCLWLSTNHGLSRFHIPSQSFVNFFKEDGLTYNEFNRMSFFKAKDGRMFFGGPRGINAFFPEAIMQVYQQKNEAIRLVLTAFERVDERLDTLLREHDFSLRPQIHLYRWDKSFQFEYALTDYASPKETRYSFKMDGYDERWSEPSKFNFTRFSSLPPGTYTFRVRASDGKGGWHPQELAVDVVVHPPWWKTWWAYLIYFLLLTWASYVIYSFLKNRLILKNQLERKQEEARNLKELDQFKSRLYANITHEFRTPLTVILGITDQMEQQTKFQGDNGLDLVRRNSRNLLTLINQMLDLSKLEDRQMPVNLVQGNVVRFLRYVVESFHSMANAKAVQLQIHNTTESIIMDYDPGKLQQVISNLLSNAIKFTPGGGTVTMRLNVESIESAKGESSSMFVIAVQDTGIGIPAAQLPHIFDRFYQADNSSTRKGEGTGIGLALTRELVRLFGGTIAATSKPGAGSTFTIHLPMHREAPPENTNGVSEVLPERHSTEYQTEENKSAIPALHKEDLPLLLLVEDNPDVLTYLIRCLEGQYRIETAANGQLGIENALEHIPDIIISDVMMPEKDGFEVCDTLKNDPRTSHIPLILLTARATVEDRITGLKRGADAYMAKPFHQEELLVQVENLLESRRRLQERFRNLDQSTATNVDADTQPEDAFLLNLRRLIEEDLTNSDLSIDAVCRHMAMSRMQLHRKIKALTGRSTALHIRAVRLQNARRLLNQSELNVSEVAYAVGFDDPKYFSRVYTEEFGMAPSVSRLG
ncbi:MAG: response regulator [Lewinellaceae bacterium]|nr:response regulator [Lewinellaceae bacterium]